MQFKARKYGFLLLPAGILLLYILVRVYNLTYLPYYNDEAEYIWYGQTASHDPAQRFISLSVGKQPLFIWLVMLFIKTLSNPLIAGRLVSVAAGLLTMLGIWLLTYRLFKDKTTAYISALLFVFYPFAEFINRQGNFDSTVGMSYVWSLYLTVLVVQTLRLDVAYALGFSLAGGILTKTSAFFSLYLLPVAALLLFDFQSSRRWQRLARLAGLLLFAVVLATLGYAILQLSPLYERILWFNGAFVYPKREWLALSIPFRINLVLTNFQTMLPLLFLYMTPVYILLLVPAVRFGAQYRREILLLLAYCVLPIAALGVFAKAGIAGRWIYPFTLPLLPLMAWGLVALLQKIKAAAGKRQAYRWQAALIMCVLVYPATQVLMIAIRPYHANIPYYEKQQFVIWNYWGLRDNVMPFLKAQAQDKQIFVGSQGLTGTFQAIKLYAYPQNNIKTKGYLLWDDTYRDDLRDLEHHANRMPTYFVGSHLSKPSPYILRNPRIRLIKQFECKVPDGSPCSIPVYRVINITARVRSNISLSRCPRWNRLVWTSAALQTFETVRWISTDATRHLSKRLHQQSTRRASRALAVAAEQATA